MIILYDGVDSSNKLQEIGSFDFITLWASQYGLSVNQYEIICLSISSIFLLLFLRNISSSSAATLIIIPSYSVMFSNQSNWGIAVSAFLHWYESHRQCVEMINSNLATGILLGGHNQRLPWLH